MASNAISSLNNISTNTKQNNDIISQYNIKNPISARSYIDTSQIVSQRRPVIPASTSSQNNKIISVGSLSRKVKGINTAGGGANKPYSEDKGSELMTDHDFDDMEEIKIDSEQKQQSNF